MIVPPAVAAGLSASLGPFILLPVMVSPSPPFQILLTHVRAAAGSGGSRRVTLAPGTRPTLKHTASLPTDTDSENKGENRCVLCECVLVCALFVRFVRVCLCVCFVRASVQMCEHLRAWLCVLPCQTYGGTPATCVILMDVVCLSHSGAPGLPPSKLSKALSSTLPPSAVKATEPSDSITITNRLPKWNDGKLMPPKPLDSNARAHTRAYTHMHTHPLRQADTRTHA